jgi:hypothetical protein
MWRFERDDDHIIVIELHKKKIRIAAMYRTYQLATFMDHTTALKEQISQLNEIFQHNNKVILLGQFNYNRRMDPSYQHAGLYNLRKEMESPISFFN